MNFMDGKKQTSCLGRIFAVFGVLLSLFFLMNPTAGILELIPDNLPLVGNLDEAFFTVLLLSSLAYLGVELPWLRGRYPALTRKDPPDNSGTPKDRK